MTDDMTTWGPMVVAKSSSKHHTSITQLTQQSAQRSLRQRQTLQVNDHQPEKDVSETHQKRILSSTSLKHTNNALLHCWQRIPNLIITTAFKQEKKSLSVTVETENQQSTKQY